MDQLERYILKSLVVNIVWSFAGDCRLKSRQEMSDYIRGITTIPLPPQTAVPIIDYEVGNRFCCYYHVLLLYNVFFT